MLKIQKLGMLGLIILLVLSVSGCDYFATGNQQEEIEDYEDDQDTIEEDLEYTFGSLIFNGEDNYAAVPYNDIFNITGAVTVELWCRYLSVEQGWSSIIALGEGSDFIFRIHNHGEKNTPFAVLNDAAGNSYYIGDLDFGENDGDWHHLAMVYDGNYFNWFVNGEEVHTREIGSIAIAEGDYNLYFGQHGAAEGSWNFWHGAMGEVRIWDRALTAQDIQTNMYLQLSGSENGLIGYWPMDEGEGDMIFDLSAYVNNGTVFGAMWSN